MLSLVPVPSENQKKRINEIIANNELRTGPGYKYEYYLLFNKQYEGVFDDVKRDFLSWVDEQKVEDENDFGEWFEKVNGRKHTKSDLAKYEDGMRASKLFLIKENFKKEYEKYRNSSGKSDTEIAPKPRVGTARFISPSEGTPLSEEEMSKMKTEEVIAYIIDEDKWKDKKSISFFNTPEEALLSAFGMAVKQKVEDYINLKSSDLIKLRPKFLTYYFDGIWIALREKKVAEVNWQIILDSVKTIISKKITSEDYEYCFRAILDLIGYKLEQKTAKEHHELIWGIIKPLTKYQYDSDIIVEPEAEKDPYDECINCVQGKAFELAIRFGLGCKKEFPDYYEKTLSEQLRDVFDFIANENSLAKVVCVFGIWLVQLHWMEEDWIVNNLDLILNEEDIQRWDAVWGSYVTWGRPAPEAFNLLAEKGKYKKAIERIEEENLFTYQKNPEEGLAEHLIIAFFNQWIEFEDENLKRFFDKSPTKLRGYAARFMTTGFKVVSEDTGRTKDEKEAIGKRLQLYWQSRLDEISKKSDENIEETVEFQIWVKDSLIEPEETLNLLYKTLELSRGELGELVYNVELVEGICDAAKGNEIKAIQCLMMAFKNPEMRMYSQESKENLNTFIDSIIEFPDDYPDIVNIRKETINLIDTIGRLCPDLREDYEKFYTRLIQKISQ